MSATKSKLIDEEWSESRTNDGYWMLLRNGFHVDGAHAIHESTKRKAYARLKDVHPCACPDCRPSHQL